MRKICLLILIIVAVMLHCEIPWQSIRFSAANQEDQMAVRCCPPAQDSTSLIYDYQETVVQVPMTDIPGLTQHVQGFFTVNQQNVNYLGFRSVISNPSIEEFAVQAVPLKMRNTAGPLISDLTWLQNDPSGDTSQQLDFLDISSYYASYNDERIYLAMQNQGGGYPVMEAAWGPFYSYMMLIVPPTEDDIFFGMLYTVDQQPYIQPGLYKMLGETQDDLIRIADINITIDEDNDLLILDCLWEDLLVDPDFTAWYDPLDPSFSSLAATSMIELDSGIEDADTTDGATIYPQECYLLPQTNMQPQVTEFSIVQDSLIACVYQDANFNFALTSQAVFPDSSIIELIPQSFDFSQPVIYQATCSHPALLDNSWQTITLHFSDDNVNFTDLTVENDVDTYPDNLPSGNLNISCYPNPFNPSATISFYLASAEQAQIAVYNVKGRLIKIIKDSYLQKGNHNVCWDGTDSRHKPVSSGIYFACIKTENSSSAVKMQLLK